MAQDWASHVKRYQPDADDEVIAGIVRYCGIALQKRDSSLVSMGDPVETGRVRENFLKKKLGLTHPDSELDSAIASVGEIMRGDNFKNRVTVYYLLADKFGMHHLFRKGGAKPAASPVAAADPVPETAPVASLAAGGAAALAGLGAAGAASASKPASAPAETMPVRPAPVPSAERLAETSAHLDETDRPGGTGWLWGLLGLALLAFVVWWLFLRHPATDTAPADTAATVAATEDAAGSTGGDGAATAAASDLAAAPAEGTVTIPEGAGVTVETRDGKPVAKVYFDSGKTEVAPAFGATAAAIKAWLEGHAGSSLTISGYNDPSGNAAANAELSKNRAKAVQAALVAAGIPESATALVKPEAATDATADKASARRVEVLVK